MTARVDSYAAAIEFLYGRINYERVDSQAYSTSDLKLDRMRVLLSLLGNPHERIPAIHVAGTKGKGSTCSMIASVLAAAGLGVGLYISPHISAFEERMTVNGIRPSPEELVALVNRLLPVVAEMDGLAGQMQPTYFELATALAWLYFEQRHVDFAVLETGLGGRLDSTNICRPVVTVITNVSRDHTHILGSTVRQIAWEKAGIIKPRIPVVSGVSHPDAIELVEQVCRDRMAPLVLLGRELVVTGRRTASFELVSGLSANESIPAGWVDVHSRRMVWTDVPVALRGNHQATNAAMALGAIEELREQGVAIPESAVRTGLSLVQWPARVEVVCRFPTVVIDAAHNWESAKALIETLQHDFQPKHRILIFAATRDKDVSGLLRLLAPAFDTVILTRYLDNPRSVPVHELRSIVQAISNRPVHVAQTPEVAWNMARLWARTEDLIAITGSFFLVAELRDRVLADSAPAMRES